MSIAQRWQTLHQTLAAQGVTLVAVSKTKPVSDLVEAYDTGCRDFGENYVQELVDKAQNMDSDIRWHFIGHLQRNKVKYIAPFVHLIHGVDTLSLLAEIEKQAAKIDRPIQVLLQVYIATEESKFGMDEAEVEQALASLGQYPHVVVRGLMGMASFSQDQTLLGHEFGYLKGLFDRSKGVAGPLFDTLSMGMSGDYALAIAHGSNMVRIGSAIFGARG